MQPLYGHTTQETAYLVRDYPYGFRLRCQIRYWLESDPKKGHRFCSQTTNPKKPGEVWNAPKKSTYTPISACMFLDDEDHVQWTGFSSWNPQDALAFVETYAQAAGIEAAAKYAYLRARSLFKRVESGAGTQSDKDDLSAWEKVWCACKRLGIKD